MCRMLAFVHTYAPTPILIEIKPYYTFGRIKRIITEETSIKPHHQELWWKRKIMRDEDIVRKCIMYLKNEIHFDLKINDF